MKTIPTKNGELLCVEVPMDARDFRLHKIGDVFLEWFNPLFCYRKISDNTDSIIGTITDGLLDFDAEPYVYERELKPDGSSWGVSLFCFDYAQNKWTSDFDYEDSFLSLLTSHKIEYSGKKIVILQTK